MAPHIPDKLYFKIGEVAELTGVKPHVLRYWESEIGSIRPTKNRQQQRVYRRRDIDLILRLKDLLYAQGYTIAGARKILRRKPVDGAKEGVASSPPAKIMPAVSVSPPGENDQLTLPLGNGIDRRLLDEVRQDLKRLRDSLTSAP